MIILTPQAVQKLKSLLAEHPEESLVRVAIVEEGDDTLTHRITLEDAVKEGDYIQDCDGVTVVMDAQTTPLMDGVALDYKETGSKPGFIFKHPEPTNGDPHDPHLD